MISLAWYLILAAALFSVGIFGVLARRNAVAILMGIELMLNAVNINLVAFWRYHGSCFCGDGICCFCGRSCCWPGSGDLVIPPTTINCGRRNQFNEVVIMTDCDDSIASMRRIYG